MKWKPYPAYKPSGVEWLGDVPEHWEQKRLKCLLQAPLQYGANEVAELDDPELPRFVRITDLDEAGKLKEETFRSLPENIAKPYLLHDGDILLARSGATVGKSFFYQKSWGKAAYAGYLIRARVKKHIVLPEFINFITKSDFYRQWIRSSLIQATIQNVSAEKYASLFLSLPSFAEQQAIVAFLDRETDRIDALLAKKERLIELLREKRSALISHAVTKGLDPSVRLKPSGVEWLGDVPDNWEIKKLKYLVSMKSGESITSEEIDEAGEYPVFGGNGLRGFCGHYTHEGLFVLIGRQGALCGNINYGAGKFWASEHAVVAMPICPLATIWLGELLRIMNLNQYSVSAAQPGLAIDKIKELNVPCPPFSEQQTIAAYLDRETGKIDALITKVETAIAKLKEYRTALISSAVTGKIDVREAA